ncbi:G-protein coupled receptor 157-like isoform X2 [Dreissena polymorpha]|uniref:G-protein coupled receptors family 2 profile 2 domain-containing protein n=1 Tax=Dreissena polymorpha TaxID=45954 RepID=A0A9D4GW27_DREPO|nr:G-protein coupled receptor 157-like isoform X2 [Dreissena polymorpha]KAH3824048.1 hypothetical protein DPMN_125876 [Dreissena polymorpha]
MSDSVMDVDMEQRLELTESLLNGSLREDTSSIPLKEDINLSVVSAVSCVLSMIGAVLIVMTYIFIPCIRNTTRKMVTCLTIADFLTPAGYMAAIAYYNPHVTRSEWQTFCVVQSALTTYSSLVSFNLTVAIALYLFISIYKVRMSDQRFITVSNLVSWIVPALSDEMLGQVVDNKEPIGTGPWCWIKWSQSTRKKSLIYMFVAGKGWEILCYLLTASCYVLHKLQLFLYQRYRSLAQDNPNLRPDDIKFLYIWIILLALRIWGTIRFFMTSVLGLEKTVYALLYLQAIGDPSQAFFNFILFCIVDTEVRRELYYGIFCDAPEKAKRHALNERDVILEGDELESEQTNLIRSNRQLDFIIGGDWSDTETTESDQSLQEVGASNKTYGAVNEHMPVAIHSSRTDSPSSAKIQI